MVYIQDKLRKYRIRYKRRCRFYSYSYNKCSCNCSTCFMVSCMGSAH